MSFIAAAVIGAGATLGATAISTFGGKGKVSTPQLPPFQPDPLVGTSENSIFNFGSDILKGILPSFYQDLLSVDSPQFESVLKNSNRDVESAGLETAARAGNARSGAAQSGISSAVANNSANLRYADYMNTLTNQKGLLGTGLDAENAAGNLALGNQGQINNYALGGYQAQLGFDSSALKTSLESQQATGAGIGSAFKDVLGALPYLQAGNPNGTLSTAPTPSILGALGTDTSLNTGSGGATSDLFNQISGTGNPNVDYFSILQQAGIM